MITKAKILFEKRGQAPAPSKDYHQLLVDEEFVIFRTWRISLRRGQSAISPTRNKQTHDDFYYDTQVTSTIRNVFGEDVLLYVQGLVHGDWLVRMNDLILIKIFSYLDLSDIFRLTPVCRHFRTICNSNMLWKSIYQTHCLSVNPDILVLGEEMGWKKLFFTNKLQARKEVSRLKRHTEERDEKEMDALIQKLSVQHLSDELQFLDNLYIQCK